MKMLSPHSYDPYGNNNGGPPGQNLLGITLAALASVVGTPWVFGYVGP